MNRKHRKTLHHIFREPTSVSIKWSSIETLAGAGGARISEGKGSRVRMYLNGVVAVFHRPHHRPTVDKGTVQSVREFLTRAGMSPAMDNAT
jgi:hypothetical protein